MEENGFGWVKEKRSIRYYAKPGHPNLVRVDFHGSREVPTGTCHAILKAAGLKGKLAAIDMPYSIVIEATSDPNFFGSYSPELEGFSGIGHSIEDCLYQARHGMADHVQTLKEQNMAVPPTNPDPTVTIHNEKRRHVA